MIHKCEVCNGLGKVLGVGLIWHECKACGGVGKQESALDATGEQEPKAGDNIAIRELQRLSQTAPSTKLDKRSRAYRAMIGR